VCVWERGEERDGRRGERERGERGRKEEEREQRQQIEAEKWEKKGGEREARERGGREGERENFDWFRFLDTTCSNSSDNMAGWVSTIDYHNCHRDQSYLRSHTHVRVLNAPQSVLLHYQGVTKAVKGSESV
jgi:hypothetical protein